MLYLTIFRPAVEKCEKRNLMSEMGGGGGGIGRIGVWDKGCRKEDEGRGEVQLAGNA